MTWRPWGPMVHQPPAEPVPPLSPSEVESARGAEPWSTNFKTLPIYEQLDEIHAHVTRAIAEAATARAEVQELREALDKALGIEMPAYFRPRNLADRGEIHKQH